MAMKSCFQIGCPFSGRVSSLSLMWPKHRCVSHQRGLSTISHIVSPKSFHANFRNRQLLDKEKVLEKRNVHPLDAVVQFDPKLHSYKIGDKAATHSVTQLAGQFFSSFNADDVIQKMMNGSRWPRAGYINADGNPYTAEQIKKKWENVSVNARNRGTWMHYNFERCFNDLPYANDLPEFVQFEDFKTTMLDADGVIPYRTEWRICAEDEGVCGTLDFIGKLPDNSFVLYDWKRLGDISSSLSNMFGNRASPPFDEYDDCDGVKYMVQLNIYKYILEKYYGIVVSQSRLVSFHVNQEGYMAVDVPNMDVEIQAMFDGLAMKKKS